MNIIAVLSFLLNLLSGSGQTPPCGDWRISEPEGGLSDCYDMIYLLHLSVFLNGRIKDHCYTLDTALNKMFWFSVHLSTTQDVILVNILIIPFLLSFPQSLSLLLSQLLEHSVRRSKVKSTNFLPSLI